MKEEITKSEVEEKLEKLQADMGRLIDLRAALVKRLKGVGADIIACSGAMQACAQLLDVPVPEMPPAEPPAEETGQEG